MPSGHSPARPLVRVRSVRRGRLVFEWGDVFGAQTEKGIPVNSEQGAGDFNPYGRFSECAEVASQQDGALSRGSSAGWIIWHYTLAVGAYHQILGRRCRPAIASSTTGIPSSPATLNPQEVRRKREFVKTVICGQDREIL